jgi:integrase
VRPKGYSSPASALANEQLVKGGRDPMPDVKPHALRRTFASLLFAIGEPPPYVRDQMGHTTANLMLELYARQMDRRDGEPERLKALVHGETWARQRVPAASGGHAVGTRAPATVEEVPA